MSAKVTKLDEQHFDAEGNTSYYIRLDKVETNKETLYMVYVMNETVEFEGSNFTNVYNDYNDALGFFTDYINARKINYEVQLIKFPEYARNEFVLEEATTDVVCRTHTFEKAQSYYTRFCSGANDSDGRCSNQDLCTARFYRIVRV